MQTNNFSQPLAKSVIFERFPSTIQTPTPFWCWCLAATGRYYPAALAGPSINIIIFHGRVYVQTRTQAPRILLQYTYKRCVFCFNADIADSGMTTSRRVLERNLLDIHWRSIKSATQYVPLSREFTYDYYFKLTCSLLG